MQKTLLFYQGSRRSNIRFNLREHFSYYQKCLQLRKSTCTAGEVTKDAINTPRAACSHQTWSHILPDGPNMHTQIERHNSISNTYLEATETKRYGTRHTDVFNSWLPLPKEGRKVGEYRAEVNGKDSLRGTVRIEKGDRGNRGGQHDLP